MAALVDEAMAAGAFGLSTGLFGPPSGYAADRRGRRPGARRRPPRRRLPHAHARRGRADRRGRPARRSRSARRPAAPSRSRTSRSRASIAGGAPPSSSPRSPRPGPAACACRATSTPTTRRAGDLRHHLPAWVHEGGLPALLGRLRESAHARPPPLRPRRGHGEGRRLDALLPLGPDPRQRVPDAPGLRGAHAGRDRRARGAGARRRAPRSPPGRRRAHGRDLLPHRRGRRPHHHARPRTSASARTASTPAGRGAGPRAPAPAPLRHVPAGPRPLRAGRGRPRRSPRRSAR